MRSAFGPRSNPPRLRKNGLATKANTGTFTSAMRRTGPIRAVHAAFFSAALMGFVFAMILAALPSLHESAHVDSGDIAHQCLATVLHSGACDDASPISPAVIVPIVPVEDSLRICARVVSSVFLSCRTLEHAPPSLS
jgi:hypothetical protein